MTDYPIETTNIAQTMRETVEELNHVDPIETPQSTSPHTSTHLLSVPRNREVRDVSDMIRKAQTTLKPMQKTGTAKPTTLQSFIDWANRFKGAESVIFADQSRSAPSLTCISDYHLEGSPPTVDLDTGDPNARYGRHKALYQFPLSEEWKLWNRIGQNPLSKADLGEFIEANAKDIIDPTPALMGASSSADVQPWEQTMIEIAGKLKGRFGQFSRLMEMSRHLEIYETSTLKTTRNPDDGTVKMEFINENNDAEGQPLSVPNLFLIAIPIFDQGAFYRIPVRFTFKKNGSAITFRLTLYNPDVSFYDALKEAVETAQQETELPTFYGTPETT